MTRTVRLMRGTGVLARRPVMSGSIGAGIALAMIAAMPTLVLTGADLTGVGRGIRFTTAGRSLTIAVRPARGTGSVTTAAGGIRPSGRRPRLGGATIDRTPLGRTGLGDIADIGRVAAPTAPRLLRGTRRTPHVRTPGVGIRSDLVSPTRIEPRAPTGSRAARPHAIAGRLGAARRSPLTKIGHTGPRRAPQARTRSRVPEPVEPPPRRTGPGISQRRDVDPTDIGTTQVKTRAVPHGDTIDPTQIMQRTVLDGGRRPGRHADALTAMSGNICNPDAELTGRPHDEGTAGHNHVRDGPRAAQGHAAGLRGGTRFGTEFQNATGISTGNEESTDVRGRGEERPHAVLLPRLERVISRQIDVHQARHRVRHGELLLLDEIGERVLDASEPHDSCHVGERGAGDDNRQAQVAQRRPRLPGVAPVAPLAGARVVADERSAALEQAPDTVTHTQHGRLAAVLRLVLGLLPPGQAAELVERLARDVGGLLPEALVGDQPVQGVHALVLGVDDLGDLVVDPGEQFRVLIAERRRVPPVLVLGHGALRRRERACAVAADIGGSAGSRDVHALECPRAELGDVGPYRIEVGFDPIEVAGEGVHRVGGAAEGGLHRVGRGRSRVQQAVDGRGLGRLVDARRLQAGPGRLHAVRVVPDRTAHVAQILRRVRHVARVDLRDHLGVDQGIRHANRLLQGVGMVRGFEVWGSSSARLAGEGRGHEPSTLCCSKKLKSPVWAAVDISVWKVAAMSSLPWL